MKLFKIDKTKAVILHYSAGTMLILLGVLVSYSRSVWLVAFLLILVVFWKYFAEFARNYFSKKFLKRFGASLFAVVLIACAGVYILASPRLCIQDCAGGQSFELRQKYAQYAFETILDNAYYGAGTGNFVLGMKDARPFNFETWQIQPVHNLYLLIAAEIGLIGFLFLFLFVFKRLKNLNKLSESWNKTGVYALAGFLSLGFFDHYFWTIPQTILFFWLAIALIPGSSKIKKANKETTEK